MENSGNKGTTDDWAVLEANLQRCYTRCRQNPVGTRIAIKMGISTQLNGTPSKGLMQVIDPTFRAYAMPGYDKNIYDPLSNMLHPSGMRFRDTEVLRLLIVEWDMRMVLEISICPIYYQVYQCWT